eukprot:Amastigsp_a174945_23.p5 type:complete len:103 gc:universal Amastigsp_a174945_23:412-104(-)
MSNKRIATRKTQEKRAHPGTPLHFRAGRQMPKSTDARCNKPKSSNLAGEAWEKAPQSSLLSESSPTSTLDAVNSMPVRCVNAFGLASMRSTPAPADAASAEA